MIFDVTDNLCTWDNMSSLIVTNLNSKLPNNYIKDGLK
jgi:hypothetical protein